MTATLEPELDPAGGGPFDPGAPPGRRRFGAPTGLTLVALVVALCFFSGAVGWTLGQGRPPGERSADVGFLRDMRTHHENAISLAQIELVNGTEPAVQVFAEEILRFQAYEIGLMDRMALDWGYRPEDRPDEAMAWMGHPVAAQDMPGIASDDELERLRSAGSETDAVFVALMIDHHAAGVAMAEAAMAQADDADVQELAQRIARTQRLEVAEMTAAAERLGLDATPDGVTFDVSGESTGMSDHDDEGS